LCLSTRWRDNPSQRGIMGGSILESKPLRVAAVIAGGLAATAATFLGTYPRKALLRHSPASAGSVLTRFEGCPACQIFYPIGNQSDPGPGSRKLGSWFRPELLAFLAQAQGLPTWSLRFLSCAPPHYRNAPVLTSNDGMLPVVVFSHGLSGSLDLYQTLCGAIAAEGYIVVALEHEDGSAIYAQSAEGAIVPKVAPPVGMPYSRERVVQFREPFLKKRLDEVDRVIRALGTAPRLPCDEVLGSILSQADPSRLYLAGHSFGAATCVKAMQELEWEVAGALIFDLWPFPLSKAVVARGIDTRCILLNSDAFIKSKEYGITAELVCNSKDAHAFGVSGSVHQSFSDTPCLLPQILGRRLGTCGESESDAVYQAMVDAAVGFLAHCEVPAAQDHLRQQLHHLTAIPLIECSDVVTRARALSASQKSPL